MAKQRTNTKSELKRAANSVNPFLKNTLNTLCEALDFNSGCLLSATEKPTSSIKHDEWLEKGEWLAAAKRAGAEKLFFVENNPVVVFAECGSADVEKVRAFNRIWSLARPRLLFLVSPGEIAVLDLAQKPLRIAKTKEGCANKSELKILKKLQDVTNVAQELQDFHRDNIESGKLFGDIRFGDLKNRADKALIRDLKTVRRELIQAGLFGHKVKFAHALIGRSIFIRYLEDRGILTKDYFLKVARQTAGWTELLNNPVSPGFDFSETTSFYPRVLQNKDFAYALFKMLSKDFNGDMFPDVHGEELNVTQEHLQLIQDLLYGDVGVQKQLFFYSYRFDIVPLDLISSIYEVFYHSSINNDDEKSKARQDGAYYTPSVLVEFVLSRVLTAKELKKKPRVLDPACGSGIFLVEAFRRIVRYEWQQNKIRLDFDTLKDILSSQIAGIEVNEEAARITAFSLYLAMLHYLDPPAITEQIKQGNTLPNLIVSDRKSRNHYHCIWIGSAFDTKQIEESILLSERFGVNCADLVIGNPPWGAPGKNADNEPKAREQVMLDWCRANDKPIGNKEHSQAFLWRALDLLKQDGRAGMLVSAGVFFKHGGKTQLFRTKWLNQVRLIEVFNFAHVRHFFFKGAISPFVMIGFEKTLQGNMPVEYWSAKQISTLKETQSILFSKYDRHVLRNENLGDNKLWKTLWFGRSADIDFLRQIPAKPLMEFVDRNRSGQGFKLSPPITPAPELARLPILKLSSFTRHKPLQIVEDSPCQVYRKGCLESYSGPRLLVKRGINESQSINGEIVCRYEEAAFCFSSAIIGIKLKSDSVDAYKLLTGIIWSSFARYYFFCTSSTWGLWHDAVDSDSELFQLPVHLDVNNRIASRVIKIVDKLRSYFPHEQHLFKESSIPEKMIDDQRSEWMAELDQAVFELYGFTEEQKDLIRDCCDVTLPFLHEPFYSIGSMPAIQASNLSWIDNYARIFSKRWNAYLGANEEMRAEVHVSEHANMVAIEFFPADKKDTWNLKSNSSSWGYVLDQIGKALPQPMGNSQITLDGVVHAISDETIIIIKRNEKRFWTRSLAREDASVTLFKRMTADTNSIGKGWD